MPRGTQHGEGPEVRFQNAEALDAGLQTSEAPDAEGLVILKDEARKTQEEIQAVLEEAVA